MYICVYKTINMYICHNRLNVIKKEKEARIQMGHSINTLHPSKEYLEELNIILRTLLLFFFFFCVYMFLVMNDSTINWTASVPILFHYMANQQKTKWNFLKNCIKSFQTRKKSEQRLWEYNYICMYIVCISSRTKLTFIIMLFIC